MMQTSGWVVAVALVLAACDSDGIYCDPNQRYSYGLCIEVDGATPAYDHFGRLCDNNIQCALPAPYCLQSASDQNGYCTVTGCDTDATLCPATWTCLLRTDQGLPAVCVQP